MSNLDDLRKHAKRWLEDVHRGNPGSVKRLRLAYPAAPANPVLRDIQHALAREQGYADWKSLKIALERQTVTMETGLPAVANFGSIASRTRGTHPDALPRYVGIPTAPYMTRPGYLGLHHGPFAAGDPGNAAYAPPHLTLTAGVDGSRLEDRGGLIARFDRAGDGTMVVPSAYLEAVIVKA